ncbi:MAG: antitoxin [Ruminiclostridium sp.]|nr:antitoxin [Ruminiclostridium sp.]
MGRTSSAVKDKWNAKTYDEIKIRVPKGEKENVQAHASSRGESVNAFINRAINNQIERDKEEI